MYYLTKLVKKNMIKKSSKLKKEKISKKASTKPKEEPVRAQILIQTPPRPRRIQKRRNS